MIFGRKKSSEPVVEEETAETPVDEQTPEAEAPKEEGVVPAEAQATWREWDEQFTRDEGPFDISEVDLEADDVKRLDLGCVIVTPFPEMNLQLQVDQKRKRVQAILVGDGASAIEVALFGAPLRASIIPEIRTDIIQSVVNAKGRVAVAKGPFGPEIRRALPVKDPEGKPGMHVSRTWLAQGPSWMLRGVVMGKAAMEPADHEASLTLFEFFANIVVRRGTAPVAPGALIPMTVPQKDA